MLRRLFVRSPAPTSNTRDSAACNTISDLCDSDDWSCVDRLTPRNASAGSEWDVIQAGTTPNTTPVASDSRNANPSTGNDGLAAIGRFGDSGNARDRIIRVPAYPNATPANPP